MSAASRHLRWQMSSGVWARAASALFFVFVFLHIKSDIFTTEFHISRRLAWNLLGRILGELCIFLVLFCLASSSQGSSCIRPQVLGWQARAPPPLAVQGFGDVSESSSGIIVCLVCPVLSPGTTCTWDLCLGITPSLGCHCPPGSETSELWVSTPAYSHILFHDACLKATFLLSKREFVF